MALSIFLDESITRTESARFLYKWRRKIKNLEKTTAFDRNELENLFIVHYKIIKQGGPITRLRFLQLCHYVLGIEERMHFEKIFSMLNQKHKNGIPPDVWAKILSIWLRGDFKQQISYVWSVYLPFREDCLSRDVIRNYLKPTIVKKDSAYEATLQEFVGDLLQKLDKDNDGKVSEADFRASVLQNPLLLECLGQCLPNSHAAEAFYITFSHRPVNLRLFRIPKDKISCRKITT